MDIDTKIKYAMIVVDEVEKSVREVYYSRKGKETSEEKWQKIFQKHVIENVKDFIYFNRNHLQHFATTFEEELSDSSEEEARVVLNKKQTKHWTTSRSSTTEL